MRFGPAIKRFALREQSGLAGIEFALTAPLLILLFMGCVTVFDVYRTYQNMVEASNIVVDMVSRQTEVNETFLTNSFGVFTNIVANGSGPIALRITSVVRKNGKFSVDWTSTKGTASLLGKQDLTKMNLPAVSDGNSLLLLEGMTTYSLLSNVTGMDTINYGQTTFTRPRFAGSVAKK